jgi:BirA family biotin operon repressor/biotin-[acetyl-CoA-carboxylase] ligase
MKPLAEWNLATTRLGRRLLVFDRLDSTNSYALAHAGDMANDGLVVLADEQTAGRGQHGRSWSCPGGSGVLMSVLVFPPAELRRPAILTAWAASAVCDLIDKLTGLQATIKWPNDVLIEGRKVCGILLEQARGTVAGIGLNVNQPAEHFLAADLPQAASLAMFTGRQQLCREVAKHLIAELDSSYDRLCRGELAELEASWVRRLGLLGRDVVIETAAATQAGRLEAIDLRQLQVRLAGGAVASLAPEIGIIRLHRTGQRDLCLRFLGVVEGTADLCV